jgi:serine/threonine protein phosphatase PrpC
MAVSTRLLCAGNSDPGLRREKNEDRFYSDPERGFFFVIDGVGGQAAGEKAAETALHLLRARLERQIGSSEERIREAITLANNEIFHLARQNAEWRGMACVLTLALIEEGKLTIGHVGDSRLYVIRAGEIRKVTHDHSPIGEREDRGEMSESEAMHHPRRNEVYRDVGSEEHTPDDPSFIEIVEMSFPLDAALLLCTDGLSDLVPSRSILQTVEATAGRPDLTVRQLINAANQAGGKDNVTVVLVEGTQFASAVGARNHSGSGVSAGGHRLVEARPGLLYNGALVIAGLLLATLGWAYLKPHWKQTSGADILAFGTVREPRIINVGETGSRTIREALDMARPGDSVLVAPGTYNEQVHLRDGVNVRSEKPREAVIATAGVAVVADQLTSGRFEGFRISGDETTVGVQVTDSDVELIELEILGAHLAGAEFSGHSRSSLRASMIANSVGPGIIVRNQASPRLVNNVITGNGKASKRPGVQVIDAAAPVLLGNLIWGNGADPVWAREDSAIGDYQRQNFFGIADPPRGQVKVRTGAR